VKNLRPTMDFAATHRAVEELSQKQLFFVGGTIKSGTTWVQVLLNGHPEVSCCGESHLFDVLAPALASAVTEHSNWLADINSAIFENVQSLQGLSPGDLKYLIATAFYVMLARSRKSRKVSVVGEKTPDNIRFLDHMDLLFKDAKFIHVVRDGRDCAVSGWFQNLRINPAKTFEMYPTMTDYVRAFAAEWVADLQRGARFAQRAPTRYHLVRYEELGAQPVATLSALYRFLGVAWDFDLVKSCCDAAAFKQMTHGRNKGDEDRDSFFRKGLSGDWRNHFTPDMMSVFAETAGKWLAVLGEDAPGAVSGLLPHSLV